MVDCCVHAVRRNGAVTCMYQTEQTEVRCAQNSYARSKTRHLSCRDAINHLPILPLTRDIQRFLCKRSVE